MANYSAIKAAVNAYIKENGRKEITGRILNAVLTAAIDSLGKFFQFAGVATPSTDPEDPDQNVCYLAGEPGTYVHFDNITLENEEIALLFYDGTWSKQRMLLGIQEVSASVDANVGTPSVDVSYSEGSLVLTFHNLKGEQGNTGAAAGFGTVGATVDDNIGTPGVSVQTSGPDTAKNLMFTFTNLKGETGVTSVVATVDNTSGTPSCAVSLVNGVLTLAFTGLKGLQGDTGVSADYPIAIVNNLTTNDPASALSAAQGVVLEGEISQLESKVDEELADGIEVRTFDHSTFTSPNDNIMVGESDIKFANVGDYLEIKVNPNGTSGYWLYRATSYNQPCMRFSSSNYLQIRFSSSVNFTYQDAVNFNWNNIVVIKVVLTAINGSTYSYDIYADGVKVGTQDAGVLWFTQIGRNTIMDLYYIKLRIGGVESTLTHFGEMTGAVGVTDVYSSEQFDGLVRLNERVSDLEADMDIVKNAVVGEDMYYYFRKTSTFQNLQSHFGIVQRLKGNIYIMTAIGYYIYSGSAGYPNGYWRIERTNLCTLIDGELANLQTQILTAGENEFVLQWLAGSGYNFSGGFSGGFHYGEKIADLPDAWVEFVADGNMLSTDADIPLTPCKSFYYREYSAIYQHNDNTIAAWHLKENHFRDGGYEVMNDVKFVQALDYFAYPGIVCVSRWLSEKAMPEGVATITDMGDGTGTPHYDFQSHNNRIHYEGNGYICDVESEVLIGADDAQCDLSVYNGADYNKYYRRNPDTAGSTSNRLKARTKVKISAV